jgi:hypothetical protein
VITQPKLKNNPLAGLMRQPKIYIKLPSGGRFWPEGSLVVSETGEYPVYSMTAKDELLIKIPDALLNGQAIVDLMQSCMPNIKNAWEAPNLDVDTILMAIRIATYGERMAVPIDTGDSDYEYDVDLRSVMSDLAGKVSWEDAVAINQDLTVFVKPINYRKMTESALQSFETQKIMQIANSSEMKEEDKLKLFKESFDKLNGVAVGIITDCVYKIESSQGSTDDPVFIKEFMENSDKEIFDKVKNHLDALREQNTISSLTINPTPAMLAGGVEDKPIEIPLIFDASTFFA